MRRRSGRALIIMRHMKRKHHDRRTDQDQHPRRRCWRSPWTGQEPTPSMPATSRIMGDIFADFRDNPDLRSAILTAAGERFFCPGWDLKAAAEGEAPDSRLRCRRLRRPAGTARPRQARGVCLQRPGLWRRLRDHDFLRHHHRRRARHLLPAGTALRHHRRCRHHQAAAPHSPIMWRSRCSMTGRVIDAEEAKHWGIINEIVPADKLMDRAREVADLLAAGPPLVYAAIKETMEKTITLAGKGSPCACSWPGACRPSPSSIPAKISWRAPAPLRKSGILSGRAADLQIS